MNSEWENGVRNVIFSYFYISKNYLCNEPFLLIYDIGIKINTKKKTKKNLNKFPVINLMETCHFQSEKWIQLRYYIYIYLRFSFFFV